MTSGIEALIGSEGDAILWCLGDDGHSEDPWPAPLIQPCLQLFWTRKRWGGAGQS